MNSSCKRERWQNDLFIMHEDLKLAEIARDYTEPGVTTRRDVWNQGKLFMYSSDKIQLPQNVSSPFDSSEVQ